VKGQLPSPSPVEIEEIGHVQGPKETLSFDDLVLPLESKHEASCDISHRKNVIFPCRSFDVFLACQ
jgi:hypothetical protein